MRTETTHFLYTRVYMGHTVISPEGKKLTWQMLRDMPNKANNVEVTEDPTNKHNKIYTIVEPKTFTYHRKPTESEIRFGHGAIHYKDFSFDESHKKDGSLKKRLKCNVDGLIYTR